MRAPRALIAALALLVVALVGWQVVELAGAAPDVAAQRDPARPDPLRTHRAPPPAAAEASRREVAPPSASAPREIDRMRDLHGRVVTADGAPVAGAAVAVVRAPAQEHAFLDPTRNAERRAVAQSATGADGGFAFALPPGRPFRLEVRAAGFAAVQRDWVYAGQRIDVVVHVGAVLAGQVKRARDGAPVAAAELRVRTANAPARLRAESDADGRFRFTGLPPGPLVLDVLPQREAPVYGIELALAPGEEQQREVLVEDGVEIRGRVYDAQTGRPIAGAEVAATWTFARAVTTDESGRYVYPGFSRRSIDLEARAPGYGRLARPALDLEAGEVARELDFALQPARVARGFVVDLAGNGIEGAYVAAAVSDYGGPGDRQRIDWRSSRSAADGAFELVDLRADVRHWLVVQKEGYGTSTFVFPGHEAEAAVVDLGTVALAPAALLRGVVVDEHDAPVAGQTLVLRGGNADRGRLAGEMPEETAGIDGYLAERRGRTDDLGRFAFGDLAAGAYVVEARRDGKHQPARVEVTVPAGQEVAGLRLVLPAGRAIAGRIAVPDGGAVPKVYVSVDPLDGQTTSADVEADTAGAFVAPGLQPGRYALTVYPYPTPADRVAGRQFVSRCVDGIAAGTRDVVIELQPQATVSGRVVDRAGAPVAGAAVGALDAEGRQIAAVTADAEGRFAIGLAERSSVMLEAARPVEEGAPAPPKARLAGIAAGSRDVELRLPE